MTDNTLIIDKSPIAMRSAIAENGKLRELIVDKASNKSLVGNIYLARVQNILPAQFAFMDIGEQRAAFLFIEDKKESAVKKGLKKDRELLVQVTKDPTGDKGAYVTAALNLSGRYCVLMPDGGTFSAVSKKITDKARRDTLSKIAEGANKRGFGIIMRTNCEDAADSDIEEEIDGLIASLNKIRAESANIKAPALIRQETEPVSRLLKELGLGEGSLCVSNDAAVVRAVREYAETYKLDIKTELYDDGTPIFERYGIEQQIQKLFNRKIWLKSGAFIIVDSTEALHVIDVNSGKFSGSGGYEKSVLKVNMEAAEEAARQIRLRNLSGIILIDFIDMKDPANKAALQEALRSFCARDRITVNVLGMTQLGLIELTRKKGREPLGRILQAECRSCGGTGGGRSAFAIAIDAYNEIARKAASTGKKEFSLQADADVIEELGNAKLPEGVSVTMTPGRPKSAEFRVG